MHRGDAPGQFSVDPTDMWGVKESQDLRVRLTKELAANISMLANSFSMERVFIGGDIENIDVDVIGLFERALDDNWVYPGHALTTVMSASLGERAVVFGAAGMLMHRFFASERLLINRE